MGAPAPSIVPEAAPGAASSATSPVIDKARRRVRQRRQILILTAISYLLDAFTLLMFDAAGTIPGYVTPAFVAGGLLLSAVFTALSETGFTNRFKDHFCSMPQGIAHSVLLLGFAFVAPQIGIMFLCSLFIVFGFTSLRSTPSQSAIMWVATTLGLAALFMLTDRSFGLPQGSPSERFATMLVFVLTIGRCIYLGIYSGMLRTSLYRRSKQLMEAYQRIEELAELDELTGAYNRRCIMRMLDEEISRTRRGAAKLSIALIDLDWFKRINDVYGHPTGDEVLRTFAITMYANIRGIDRFGRYGGEEFLLVLPDSGQDAAQMLLDRLREIVADLDWSSFSSGMTVTMSAGVAALAPSETSEALLARVDAALYQAKAQGRNRVVGAKPPKEAIVSRPRRNELATS